MSSLGQLYSPSLALLTDLYQLTMSYGYWKAGMGNHESVFHLFYRKNPFKGGYGIAAGLEHAIDLVTNAHFQNDDLEYLATLVGNDGNPLFEDEFLHYLQSTPLSIDMDAVPEGSVVFPHEPIIRVRGNIIPCQLFETPLLTLINFQTLIATKASRVCAAAKEDTVLEFGLRRAQGFDGGLSASRAAYIGGCHATSNVMAGKLFDIPVRGTHAHAWVMMFDTEMDAFETYAKAMPNNCVFLVDTYNTVEGVRKAAQVGQNLRAKGHEMVGVRLDSGDMADLSKHARKILDDAGFHNAKIVASDSLDELKLEMLKSRGAQIDVWGVGTNLVTARDQPALGGVYKLAAVREPGGAWEPKIKLSNTPIKVSNPGIQQIRRYYRQDGRPLADMIYDELKGPSKSPTIRLFDANATSQSIELGTPYKDMLESVVISGSRVKNSPDIHHIRSHAKAQLASFDSGVRRFHNPTTYPVGLENQLHSEKMMLFRAHR
ncbi:MAG: nicotinate phosphoribosyltransferase [Myxococcota bacterium]